MTTQVLFRPLSVIMGDTNDVNTRGSNNFPNEDSQSLKGISDVPLSTTASSASAIAAAERPDTSVDPSSQLILHAEAVTVGGDAVDETEESITAVEASAVAPSASSIGTSAASFFPTSASQGIVGRETDIVSHLRRSSSSSGNSRQDIETALKARGKTDASLNYFGNNARAVSMSASPMIHPSAFGLGFGHNVNNNPYNNNNMAALAAASVDNPYASLLMNPMTAGNSNNNTSNGVFMLNPQLMMAAGFGMGGFGNTPVLAPAGGKLGSVLDSRFRGAFLGGGSDAVAAAMAATKQSMKRKPLTLYMDCDTESLSEYQCLIRQQIELFEADKSEALSSVQGRNKQIVEGQVGIRCRHCAAIPPRQRQKGSMYFPTKLDRIYQAAQNLSTFHLCDNCTHVPENVRKRILLLRERKSPAGGGKRYWAEGVRCLGVTEDQNGLRFR
jgi:hypothetical protein